MATTVTRQESLFYTHTLPNGLQMLGQLMPEVQSTAAVFWVKTGARDESSQHMGVSHFLEHMAFRRTQRMSGEEIDRAFEEMGAEHNAATWLEMTFYWARVLSYNSPWAIQVLADLTHPVLDKEDFDQERQVILEEIARYEDLPSHVLLAHFMEDFYDHTPLAHETLGTSETIKSLNVEEMRNYWRRRYGTKNMIFAIAGSFDWESVIQEVETLSGDWEQGETGRKLYHAQFKPSFHVYQRPKFTQQQIAIGTPTVPRSDPRYFAAAVLATIVGDDTGSRLYWALRHPGLAESATTQVMAFEDNGVMFNHISTEPSKAEQALQVARQELHRVQNFDIRPDELERAKAKLTASVIIGGESTNERVMSLIRSWLAEGKLETLEELRRKIEVVSLDDLKNLLHDFPMAPAQVMTSVGPLGQDQLHP